ncbi:NUDIX domain-containing protein [Streptomyces tendae]|uniref:NUDIX domain-containing protein n=1 Tax=Streptomyces tendae TaxID=1932 RepID=UPI0036BA8438
MTTTPTADETPVTFTDEHYGAQRAEAAVWAGASVLITDRRGLVLVERVGYRDTRLLPGGAVDKGESPAQAAARELREELGVTMALDRGLAVDWVSTAGANARPAMRSPGEVLHVFDGGTWDDEQIAAIRPRAGEIEAVEFVEPARLPELMSPDNARRALSALRARINAAGPAQLEDGLPIAPHRPGPSRCSEHCPPPAPLPLPYRSGSRMPPRTPGVGLALCPGRPHARATGAGHGRGVPARRHSRTPGLRRPCAHTASGNP